MPEPSSGNHYTLLPLAGDKNVSMGVLLTFVAAKLTVSSTHSSSGMGVHLKLPGRFGPDLDSDGLISEPALCCGPIWKNADFIVQGDDGLPLLENGDPVAMESPIKVAPVDQDMPLNCAALTNVGYEPKFANNAFAFRETVTEMRQCLNKTKAEAAEWKPGEPMITEECHQEAVVAARAPMYASKNSNIIVAPIPGMEFVDADHSWELNKIKEKRSPLRQQVHWLRLQRTQSPWRPRRLPPKPRPAPGAPSVHLTPGIYVRHWDR